MGLIWPELIRLRFGSKEGPMTDMTERVAAALLELEGLPFPKAGSCDYGAAMRRARVAIREVFAGYEGIQSITGQWNCVVGKEEIDAALRGDKQ